MQIRYTIFSRSLCVRHLQTILPYSPYLHGIFTIYSNFTPHTRIYFCKAESFFAELELTFSIHLYQKNERAIQFYLREEFSILSECVDDNTGEKEFTMVWKR